MNIVKGVIGSLLPTDPSETFPSDIFRDLLQKWDNGRKMYPIDGKDLLLLLQQFSQETKDKYTYLKIEPHDVARIIFHLIADTSIRSFSQDIAVDTVEKTLEQLVILGIMTTGIRSYQFKGRINDELKNLLPHVDTQVMWQKVDDKMFVSSKLLTEFVSKWKRPDGAYEKSAVYNFIPDGKDRVETLRWLNLQLKLNSCRTVSKEVFISLYLYITNTIEGLNSNEHELLRILSQCLNAFNDDFYGDKPSGDFVDAFTIDIETEAAKGYGNLLSAKQNVEVFAKFEWSELRYTQTTTEWVVYCVVVKGVPHIALTTEAVPFKLNDAFHRLYTHYKRNPTYDYGVFTISMPRELIKITFVIDGSSDTDISRLFWTGSKRKALLIPTQDVFSMVQLPQPETIPKEYEFISNLARSEGKMTYIDKSVGKFADRPVRFLDVYAEILSVQEKLWKQASDNRLMAGKSLEEIATMAALDEKCVIKVYKNWEMTSEERRKIRYADTCSNLNRSYEEGQYNDFVADKGKKFYIVATPLEGNKETVLAFVIATEEVKNNKEVHIDLFCKSKHVKTTKAARYVFPFALKYFAEYYDYISLYALSMAIPFYESFGFIRTPGKEDWVLPIQKGKRSGKRLYDPEEFRNPIVPRVQRRRGVRREEYPEHSLDVQYEEGQRVRNGNRYWQARRAHKGFFFEDDWTEIVFVEGGWHPVYDMRRGITYLADTLVVHDGLLYRARGYASSGRWDPDDWDEVRFVNNEYIPVFSENRSYNSGARVIRDGNLYEAVRYVPDGYWVNDEWQKISTL